MVGRIPTPRSFSHTSPALASLTPPRHYLEFLLVAVVALCTLENDVIHAGYLALALLFFRQRIALRAAPGRWVTLRLAVWSCLGTSGSV